MLHRNLDIMLRKFVCSRFTIFCWVSIIYPSSSLITCCCWPAGQTVSQQRRARLAAQGAGENANLTSFVGKMPPNPVWICPFQIFEGFFPLENTWAFINLEHFITFYHLWNCSSWANAVTSSQPTHQIRVWKLTGGDANCNPQDVDTVPPSVSSASSSSSRRPADCLFAASALAFWHSDIWCIVW